MTRPITTNKGKKTIKMPLYRIGDIVGLKNDIRGFVATYIVLEIRDNYALLGRNHFWKTDPCIGKFYAFDKLKLIK